MNNRQKRTLASIYESPTRANIAWGDIESLFRAVGATITEGRGSRVRIEIGGMDATFHRPHPNPETDKGAVGSVRRFLMQVGVQPEEEKKDVDV